MTSTSTFVPPLRSAKCRIASKNELLRDEKSDFITALPRMISKLCIDESAKKNVADKSIQEEITKRATPLYDVAGISSEELQTFLRRITENTQQPFSFLANISKEFADDTRSTVNAKKPTEIDVSDQTYLKSDLFKIEFFNYTRTYLCSGFRLIYFKLSGLDATSRSSEAH